MYHFLPQASAGEIPWVPKLEDEVTIKVWAFESLPIWSNIECILNISKKHLNDSECIWMSLKAPAKVKARGPTGEQLAEPAAKWRRVLLSYFSLKSVNFKELLLRSKKLPIRVGPWDVELRREAETA